MDPKGYDPGVSFISVGDLAKAFDTLKRKLCQYPILRLPDLSKPYVVVTDASNHGLGAALCQRVKRIKL